MSEELDQVPATTLLVAYGFSYPKAMEVALDARRGDAYACAFVNLARNACQKDRPKGSSMSEMIERVASEILAIARKDVFEGPDPSVSIYTRMARAAIEAMCEPTQEMIAAMEDDGGHSISRWEAAISAALQD